MWVFLNNAFLSIVDPDKHGGPSPKLLVRARFEEDIGRVFPGADVEHTEDHDYAYRALILREIVSAKMAQSVEDIDYHNFKGSVAEKERHNTYADVWLVMFRAQMAAEYENWGRPNDWYWDNLTNDK